MQESLSTIAVTFPMAVAIRRDDALDSTARKLRHAAHPLSTPENDSREILTQGLMNGAEDCDAQNLTPK